jgi:phenylacetate-CoA ligase
MKEIFDQFLGTLAKTERLPARALAHYQQGLLIRLVRHAHAALPFYRDRLACLVSANGQVDLSRWSDVPILRRDEVAARGGEMRVHDLDPEYGEIAEARTSGSTGVALDIATNGMVYFCAMALLTRMARRFGMKTARPLATIGRYRYKPIPPWPEGSISSGWSMSDPDTPAYQLDLTTPVVQQLEWLARRKAPYLRTQPSAALAIADAVTPGEGRALGIETVLLNGENVPEGARETIAERLGARAAVMYACQEIGHIASECEAAPHYHVAAENALVEIVDDRGRDVRPGERGRVIVTGLYNYVMPFIRYELGDIAVAGMEGCPCGRTLPVIAQVEGRSRNAFVFRDGSRMWPRPSMVRAMAPFVPFSRFQLVQRDFEKIEFRYVPDGSGRAPDVVGLNLHARAAFHPSVEFEPVAVAALRPGESGKFEEFICEVPAARPDGSPRR